MPVPPACEWEKRRSGISRLEITARCLYQRLQITEPRPSRFAFAALAQSVEHIIRNDGVTCSSHVSGTISLKPKFLTAVGPVGTLRTDIGLPNPGPSSRNPKPSQVRSQPNDCGAGFIDEDKAGRIGIGLAVEPSWRRFRRSWHSCSSACAIFFESLAAYLQPDIECAKIDRYDFFCGQWRPRSDSAFQSTL